MGITKKELPQLQIRSGQTAFIVPMEAKANQPPADLRLPMHWYCTSWGKGEFKLQSANHDVPNGDKSWLYKVEGSDGWWTMHAAACQ